MHVMIATLRLILISPSPVAKQLINSSNEEEQTRWEAQVDDSLKQQ